MDDYRIEFERLRLINTIEVLENTIEWYKPQIEPHDCGWMYDTIGGMKYRIQEARQEIKKLDKSKKKTNNSIS